MADISFYHMTVLPVEKSIAKLLEKAYEAGKRVVVLCASQERVDALDHFLWTYGANSFLPHGSKKQGFAADQPLWLTTTLENPNNASILMVLDGTKIEDFLGMDRCLDLFDGQDENAARQARERWRTYKNENHALTYWYQAETGAWERKEGGD